MVIVSSVNLDVLDGADDVPGCSQVPTSHTVVYEGPDGQPLYFSILNRQVCVLRATSV